MERDALNLRPSCAGAPDAESAGRSPREITSVRSSATPVTELLARVSAGDREAFDLLIPVVYRELHRIAEGYLRREWENRTMQATALIHEAYVRLVEQGGAPWQTRAHFFGVAARLMRQILVDHARSRNAAKRGAGMAVTLEPGLDVAPQQDRVMIALDDALKALGEKDERKARLVEMRFFAGMTAIEIGECLHIPVHIVRRELHAAQAWLRREMAA